MAGCISNIRGLIVITLEHQAPYGGCISHFVPGGTYHSSRVKTVTHPQFGKWENHTEGVWE